MQKHLSSLVMAFAVVFALLAPVAGEAAVPKKMEKVVMKPPAPPTRSASDVVRGFYDTLLAVMKQGESLKFQGRYEKLTGAVDQAFNTADMMRVAAGPAWVKASADQKGKLADQFRNFTIANYANQFKAYDGEKFEVLGEKNGPQKDEVIVETRLTSGAETHDLNYLMRKGEKGWRIVDVFVNGTISEMATRRSEFGSVLRAKGADALVDLLGQKSRALGES